MSSVFSASMTVAGDHRPQATDLHHLGIVEAAHLIERRLLSPVELTHAFIDHAQSLDPPINAFLLSTAERALAQARDAEAETLVGL